MEIGIYGILLAITPRIARFLGDSNKREITIETQQALLLAGCLGIISMMTMFAAIPFIPLLGASDQVTKIEQGYTEIIAYSLPISGICWVIFAFLEGHSLMRFIVFSSLAAVSLNIVLDYIFVFGKMGLPALGGIDCAWTTTTIYWLWGISGIIYTAKHKKLKGYQIYSARTKSQ